MVNRYCYLTRKAGQTRKLGNFLAKEILKTSLGQKALTLGLEGDLGGGKTTFLQGFAKGLRVKEKILSPTFVLMKRFQIPLFRASAEKSRQNLRFKNFYHIDCYRLKNSKETRDMDFKKIISNPENIVALEWADKIKKILPKKTIWIKFGFVKKNHRQIEILW